jgi:hypothetical protein
MTLSGRPNSRNRLRDWVLLVVSSTALSLALVTLALRAGAGNLLDQLMRERGLPSSLTIAVGLVAIVLICGVLFVVLGSERAGERAGRRTERPENERQIGS